jgi:hypothetical protein
MMENRTERVRRRAYLIWLDEGRPEGRESIHWDMASELVAIEDSQKKTTRKVRRAAGNPEIAQDRAEPTKPAAAMGEVPTMTDAGEQTYPPSRAAARPKAVGTASKTAPKSKSVPKSVPKSAPKSAPTPAAKAAAKPAPADKAPVKTAAARSSHRDDIAYKSSHRDDVAQSPAGREAGAPKPSPRGKK